MKPKEIKRIIIHHSASDFGDAKLIDKWHKERGWKGIGYHFVVLNGKRRSKDKINEKEIGLIEKGRKLNADPWLDSDEVGAHCYGYNSDSIAICLIHDTGKYDPRQLMAYRDLCAGLCVHFRLNPANIYGHYELDDNKPFCPSLDMTAERIDIGHRLIWAKTFYMNRIDELLREI